MVQNVREQSIEHLSVHVKSSLQRKLLHLTSISLMRQALILGRLSIEIIIAPWKAIVRLLEIISAPSESNR